MGKTAIYDLGVPFTEHFQQPASIVESFDGIAFVRRFNGIFKPAGDAWICEREGGLFHDWSRIV
jgi:hypothetical protein